MHICNSSQETKMAAPIEPGAFVPVSPSKSNGSGSGDVRTLMREKAKKRRQLLAQQVRSTPSILFLKGGCLGDNIRINTIHGIHTDTVSLCGCANDVIDALIWSGAT